jgi:uncharacterized Zn finger protein
MQIIVKCPNCSHTWMLKGSTADRRVSCCKCGMLFKVPSLDEVPKASKVIKHAKGDIYVDEAGNTFG